MHSWVHINHSEGETLLRVSEKRNTLMAATSIDAMMYGGISIVVLIGVLAIGMGMAAGK